MKTNVIWRLVLKDFQLQSRTIIFSIAGGAAALALLLIGSEMPIVIGTVCFFISMASCACFLPMLNIVNEKKKQTLPFIMSLPVSSARYGVAKLVSTVGLFLVLLLALVGIALYMILVRHVLPIGVIPIGLIVVGFPLVGFCLITGAALVSESEGWATAALAIVNSSYWLVWYLLVTRVPSLTKTARGSVAVWSPTAVNILVVEFAIVLLTLGLSMYLQSRKRSFI